MQTYGNDQSTRGNPNSRYPGCRAWDQIPAGNSFRAKGTIACPRHPLIHHAVAEAAECGIETVVLIISPGMESVGAYFDARPELEAALERSGRTSLFEQQRQIADMANVVMVTQPEPRGLGHAVYLAHQEIGAEHFAVILPDDFIKGRVSALAQLLEVHDERGGSVLAARAVPDEVVPTKASSTPNVWESAFTACGV